MSTKGITGWIVVAAIFAAVGVWQWQWDGSGVDGWIDAHPATGAVLYVAALAASVVLLPFSSLPLLPLATRAYGVWITALLSTAGWWIGCLAAFQVARWGRRYVERFAPLDTIDKLEQRIPRDIGFGGIVVLRMLFPVDVVSFALGLLKSLSFATYAVASLIGIVPFAAVYAYAGGELGRGGYLSFLLVVVAAAGVLLTIRHFWNSRRT